ncbi:MAG: class B sortase [Ruminococcus sp.]|nr:class B sortase [Ruminococcus sp.]
MENNNPNVNENVSADSSVQTRKKLVSVVLICVLSVAILVASVAGALFLIDYLGVDTSVATPDEATVPAETVVETTADAEEITPTLPDGTPYTETQDWVELKNINTDIKAWIHIPNTAINYPVLMSDKDGYGYQYYLHRNYDGSYLYAGSIFIDYRSSQGVNSKNIITHGHKMNNGTMYHDLVNYGSYSGDLEYYKQAPTLFFSTPEGGVEQWIIFAVYKTNTLERHGDFFNYFHGEFSSDAQFMNYVYNVKMRSLFNVPVPINEDDQLITLSTCSHEYTDFRTVMVARKIRAGESVKEYIDKATVNETPYWPDVYYTDHSTTRPELTTFKTELSKGTIDWYDGQGDLKGSEWLISAKGNKSFTVTFLDWDGSILSTQNVTQGKDAIPPEDPVRPDDEYYTYKFIGWQFSYTNITCNKTIAPSFEPILKEQ